MMNRARLLLTAGVAAGIFTAGNAAETPASDRAPRGGGLAGESHAGWTTAKADDGRTVPVRTYASWSRAYARASEARHSGDHGYTAYGAAWDYLGWSHIFGYPYYGYGYPFFAGGVAGDSLGAVTPGALGTSRYGWW
jgi:hypothetical protein